MAGSGGRTTPGHDGMTLDELFSAAREAMAKSHSPYSKFPVGAAILTEETGKGAFPFVLHCFSSGRALAETGIELGGYVSFSGILTFKNSQEIRDIAKDMPADRVLVETDAPYLAPPPHRGKRNEPAYVINTAQVLADTRGVTLDAISETTTANFYRLFSKVPRHDG